MKISLRENLPKTERKDNSRWKEAVISKDRRYHILSGKPLYEEKFDEVMSFHEPGLAPAKLGKDWFHICGSGKRAYSATFDRAWGFYYGLAAVNKNGEAFHITPKGIPAYKERFSWVGNFQENVCAVRDIQGNYFHILPDGTRLYSETYRYVGDFKEGVAAVFSENGTSFHIDKEGAPIYSHRFQEVGQFHKGISPARDVTGAFHINKSGDRVYADVFSEVEPFYNGRAKVRTRDGRLITVDEEGNFVDLVQSNDVNPLMKLSHDLVGYWKSFLLKGSIDLGIFWLLPATTDSLSRTLNIPAERLTLLLMALRERGYVSRGKRGLWSLGQGYEQIKNVPQDMLKSVSEHWLNQVAPSWYNIIGIIQSGHRVGIPSSESVFSMIDDKPGGFDNYQKTMEFYASIDYRELPELIDFSKHRTIIDAGGGTGYLLSLILKRAKHSTGYVLDLPSATVLRRNWELGSGKISRISCDLFKRWPVNGDAVILAKVLHDWDDVSAARIIGRARDSLAENGSLYIVERVLAQAETSGSILSLHQYLVNGGRERTIDEYAKLAAKGRMKIIETLRLSSGMTVIHCIKIGRRGT